MPISICLFCKTPLKGRSDKKFCDVGCRSNFNNQKNLQQNAVMRTVNAKLRKNRKILSNYLPQDSDNKKIHKDYLILQGFELDYFTNIYTTQQSKVYHFIYDYGYLKLSKDWYLIVKKKMDYGET